MTPTEAYEFTMQKVNELREIGIEVTITPSNSRDSERTVKKYSRPEKTPPMLWNRIPPELWNHVTFSNPDAEQARMIHEAANYLGMCGITFDTGGGCGARDWELDWSFKYNKGEEDREWRNGREHVEDMIKDMCDCD